MPVVVVPKLSKRFYCSYSNCDINSNCNSFHSNCLLVGETSSDGQRTGPTHILVSQLCLGYGQLFGHLYHPHHPLCSIQFRCICQRESGHNSLNSGRLRISSFPSLINGKISCVGLKWYIVNCGKYLLRDSNIVNLHQYQVVSGWVWECWRG